MKKSLIAGPALLSCLLAYNSFAQVNVWWDNNKAAAASSGTWDTNTTNWSLTSALSASTVAFTNGNTPEFAAGSTTITALTISVNSAVTCAGMATGLSGALVTTTTFSGSGSIGISSGMQVFSCGSSSTVGNFAFAVPLTGSGGLEQEGKGYIYLETANTYSGGTVLNGGQIVYYINNNSFGTGAITVAGTGNALFNDGAPTAMVITNDFIFPTAGYALDLAGGNPVAGAPGTTFTGTFSLPSGTTTLETSTLTTAITEISGIISGSGAAVTISDAGTLEFGGVNTYTGGTTIASSTLAMIGSGTLGATTGPLALNGGALNLGMTSQTVGAVTFDGGTVSNGTLTGTSYTGEGGSEAYTAVLAGPGAWTQTSGTTLLSGTNTYTGITTINNGLIQFTNDYNLGAAPGSYVANQLTLNNNTTGGLNYGLRLQTQSATMNAHRGITLGANGGSIQAQGGFTLAIPGIITGTGPLSISPNDSAGYGTINLSGANSYTGATIVNAGTLTLGASGTLPTGTPVTVASSFQGVANGSFFNLNGKSQTIGTLTSSPGIPGTGLGVGTPTVQLGTGGVLTINETSSTVFNGIITGGATSSVTLNGAGNSLTLNGLSTYSGPTTISAGTLIIGGGWLQGGSYGGAISIASTGTFSYASSSNQTLSGVISGAGSLVQNGSGTLTLSKANTYNGGTTVNSGTLDINATGSIAGNVTISAGTLEMDNAAAMASSATLNVAASGTTVNLTYGGTQTINALFIGGVQQAPGVYGLSAYNPGGIFTGSGTLTISSGPPVTISPPTVNNSDQLVISWNSVSGGNYNVYTTTSLNAPITWTLVNLSPIPATGTSTSYTLPGTVSGNPHVFVTVQQ